MTDKSVIIIGAGIAGLAAGCYARMNGYRTQIFELHDLPGGLCTAWERGGYVFDGVSTTCSAQPWASPIIACGRSWAQSSPRAAICAAPARPGA
jgi:phytoene dehydrogenase-like protein